MYYSDKLESLKDIFGTPDVRLSPTHVHVGSTAYPVIDDVIVVLDTQQYPPSVRKRLNTDTKTGSLAAFAEDIQFSFGDEWKSFPEVLPEHEPIFRGYFDLVDLAKLKDKRVCDLGCGIGRWSYFLQDRCRELVLVDFSDAIFVARKNLQASKNSIFIMGDIKRLPLRPDFCDFLFSLGVLHHLPSDALTEVRALKPYAPSILIYLYYALDNRPWFHRALLHAVSACRAVLSRVRSHSLRMAFSSVVGATVYVPLVWLGRLLKPFGLADNVPLYQGYDDKNWHVIKQDVYDRFFTRIEQRVTRDEIIGLKDSFQDIKVSTGLPYWHFLCTR